MSRMKILAGDIPPGTELYTNPGSISDLPVTGVSLAEPESIKKAGLARGLGIGRKVFFVASFVNGKQALIATDPRTFERISRDIADGPVSTDTIAARKKENMRTGVIFLGVFCLSLFVFTQYFAGSLSFLAAFGVALVAGVLARSMGK